MKRSDAEWRDEGLELEQEVVRHISGADFQGAHPGFDALALRLFRYQFRFNDPYRRFCENLGVRVDDVDSWSSAPSLPTDAFKVAPLRTFPPEETRATFKTSGTSGGARGHHLFTSLEIYNIALLSCFERFMLPDGARLSILSLIPPAGDVPDSSLSYMIELLMRTVGSD